MSTLDLDFSADFRPLAARMRPERFEHYIGQEHLLAPGKPLRRAIEAGQCHSMILWGPPGTGKTTLAELMAHYCQAEVERVSAVTSGVKEIRAAIDKARDNKYRGIRTLLFVDEVHRFNKSQQDAFLPHIEDGTIIFIGATTENPSFELNNALLSRARVYLLKRLDEAAIEAIIRQALTDPRGLAHEALQFAEGVLKALVQLVDGDGRKALNYLELLNDMVEEHDGRKLIDRQLLAEVTGERMARFDNQGDLYYDLISAVHKSIRGSA
ncbi:MAG: AAA family ATPase, partial [Aeromonadaceae bacterium]|nr:AAA family ATPase [Aeromonadaceae bacterium]